MIRDPSDGSIKPPLTEEMIALLRSEMKKPPGPDLTHEPTRKFMAGEYSGLQTGSSRPEEIERLRKSREWLNNFRAKRGTER